MYTLKHWTNVEEFYLPKLTIKITWRKKTTNGIGKKFRIQLSLSMYLE